MQFRVPRITPSVSVALAFVLITAACGDGASPVDGDSPSGSITIYSGRNEELIADLIERFEEGTGIDTSVRYASSPELTATLREEGDNSPADIFFAVDPASLGAIAESGLFVTLPDRVLDKVPARFSDRDGRWVGTSGRSRVVVYDTTALAPDDLPDDVAAFTDPAWKGRLAVAPTNGSFQAFVAAMILIDGEQNTRSWLEALGDNDPGTYPKNSVIVAAVNDGERVAGLVNHYYLLRLQAEENGVVAANHFLADGPGALVMPAGVGVLTSSANPDAALAFVEFLLSDETQRYFAEETFEYPLVAGVSADRRLPPLEELDPPDLDLSELASVLDRATDLIAEAGLL